MSTYFVLQGSNFIVEAAKAKKLIDIILEVKCPVVLEFHEVRD